MVFEVQEWIVQDGPLVFIVAGLYDGPCFYCARLFTAVLYFSALYAKAGTGKTAGGLACYPGERYRSSCFYSGSVSSSSDELLTNNDLRIFLYQCYAGSLYAQYDKDRVEKNTKPGDESEACALDRIQPCCRAVYRQGEDESGMGL